VLLLIEGMIQVEKFIEAMHRTCKILDSHHSSVAGDLNVMGCGGVTWESSTQHLEGMPIK